MDIKNVCVELGSGIFEKPQALGDYLVKNGYKSSLIICPNSSDIRFVENILRRRSIPARRITEFLEQEEIAKISTWLSEQNDIVVVCGIKCGIKIASTWGVNIIFYSPLNDFEIYSKIASNEESSNSNLKEVVSLLSPQELPAFVEVRKQIKSLETIQIKEEDSILSQKEILDKTISNLPSRGSILALGLTEAYAKELGIQNTQAESPSMTTLKKLITFLMENSLGNTPKNSIEEELLIVSADDQENLLDENRGDNNRGRNNPSSYSKNKHRGNDNSSNRYNNKRQGSYNSKNGGDRKNNKYKDKNRGDDRYNDRNNRNKRNEKPTPQYFPIRLYVGLGDEQGLKPHEIKDFISKNANVEREEIGFATVRNCYSFVDLTKSAADIALSKESGYEYEGRLITVERALTAHSPKRRHSDKASSDYRENISSDSAE